MFIGFIRGEFNYTFGHVYLIKDAHYACTVINVVRMYLRT